MSEVQDEEVLCIKEETFKKVLGEFAETGGVLAGRKVYGLVNELLQPDNLFFLPRSICETDQSFKQIIPYAVIRRGNEIFRYQRTKKGGESRLHDKWSIGVGGHVNPGDHSVDDNGELSLACSSISTYDNAFWRELQEEISFDSTNRESVSAPIVGIVYENKTEVGCVHLGIVHLVYVGFDRKFEFNDPGLANGQFVHVMDLKRSDDNFELWSELVIKHVL